MPKINKKIGEKSGDYNLKERVYDPKGAVHNYTTDDANNLLVWIRGNSATDLQDDSNIGRTVIETNLGSVSNNSINYQNYTQRFDSVSLGDGGANSQFRVLDADDLSFTDGSDTDSAFSASLWVKFNESKTHGLFAKSAGNTTTREYFATIADSSGVINFTIIDEF